MHTHTLARVSQAASTASTRRSRCSRATSTSRWACLAARRSRSSRSARRTSSSSTRCRRGARAASSTARRRVTCCSRACSRSLCALLCVLCELCVTSREEGSSLNALPDDTYGEECVPDRVAKNGRPRARYGRAACYGAGQNHRREQDGSSVFDFVTNRSNRHSLRRNAKPTLTCENVLLSNKSILSLSNLEISQSWKTVPRWRRCSAHTSHGT